MDSTTELAERLIAADTGGWSADGLRATAAALGWTWTDEAAGPVLRTDRASGDARLTPVGEYGKRYTYGEEYVELVIPVGQPEPGDAAQAEAFRAVNEELTAALGKAPVMGSHGEMGPFYSSGPSWGNPFLRWRGKPNTLELRAGKTGPELVLQPTGPAENWFWRQGTGEEHSISGYFGHRPDPANAGLGFPGGWTARNWDTVTSSLADFLGPLPAETSALGARIGMPVYGRTDGGAPILFDITCGERLSIACFAPDSAGPAALGWGTVAEYPATARTWDDDDPVWRIDAGGPGAPKGRALAEMLVATAQAVGVQEPAGLIVGGEGTFVGDYSVTYYGLGLPTG
ncbi:hypothetical protein [Streptomyces xantholiticus]|uniref:Uncharacterized protein n=1 Tax=Streptomyces xantholiticus TaxID=68285 RepID=A0ABV1UQV7_9ACTN